MINPLETPQGTGASIVSALVGAALVARATWRRLAKDELEVAKDRAERDHVQTLQVENKTLRDRYDTLAGKHAENLRLVGELTATVQAQTQHIARLEHEVATMKEIVEDQRAVIDGLRGTVNELVELMQSRFGPA